MTAQVQQFSERSFTKKLDFQNEPAAQFDGKLIPMTAIQILARKFKVNHSQALLLAHLSDGKSHMAKDITENCLLSRFVSPQSVSTLIYRVNAKIKPLRVSNIHGKGYMLEGENLEAVRAVIGGGQ